MGVIGRNQQCPCGSGKKFKKCCMRDSHLSEMKDQLEMMKISAMKHCAGQPCFICGKEPDLDSNKVGIGFWMPNEEASKEMGVPSNKKRFIPYPCCDDCSKLENLAQLAEDKIFAMHKDPSCPKLRQDHGKLTPEYN